MEIAVIVNCDSMFVLYHPIYQTFITLFNPFNLIPYSTYTLYYPKVASPESCHRSTAAAKCEKKENRLFCNFTELTFLLVRAEIDLIQIEIHIWYVMILDRKQKVSWFLTAFNLNFIFSFYWRTMYYVCPSFLLNSLLPIR